MMLSKIFHVPVSPLAPPSSLLSLRPLQTWSPFLAFRLLSPRRLVLQLRVFLPLFSLRPLGELSIRFPAAAPLQTSKAKLKHNERTKRVKHNQMGNQKYQEEVVFVSVFESNRSVALEVHAPAPARSHRRPTTKPTLDDHTFHAETPPNIRTIPIQRTTKPNPKLQEKQPPPAIPNKSRSLDLLFVRSIDRTQPRTFASAVNGDGKGDEGLAAADAFKMNASERM